MILSATLVLQLHFKSIPDEVTSYRDCTIFSMLHNMTSSGNKMSIREGVEEQLHSEWIVNMESTAGRTGTKVPTA